MTVNLNTTNNFTGFMPSFSKKNKMTPIGIKDNTESGVIKSSFDKVADLRKFIVKAEEYPKGAAVGLAKGGIVGTLAMSSFWALNRLSGKGVEGQGWVKTPIKVASEMIGSITKKIFKAFKKPMWEVAIYPVITGPKQLFNHIKNIKGVGTFGKVLAVGTGVGVLAMELFSTKLKVNQKTAEIDHKFYTGHRNV